MKKNIIPLVVIALVVAVASTGIFYGLIVSRMDGSSGQRVKPRFVTVRALEAGHVLRAEDYRLVATPDPGVPTPQKAEELPGRVVKEPVAEGKPLTEALLSPLSERAVQSGIPEGMRAVTVHISDSSSVVKMIQPGDHVDVQSLIQRQRNGEHDFEIRTLLQNATVFNVSNEVGPQSQPRSVLTLLSTPQDAERLSVADAGARLRVVLRNHKDQKILTLGTTSLLNLGGAARPIVTSNFVAAAPLPKPAAAPVELEVSLLEVTPEQLCALAPGQKAGALTVSSASVQELRRAQKVSLLASSKLVAGKAGEFSWSVSEQTSMRLRIEPLPNSGDGRTNLRIQPEATLPQSGTATTRRVDSNVNLAQHQVAIVSGLFPAEQIAQLRERLKPGTHAGGGELLMVITPSFKQ